ncbi:MAG TPA: hypothetical protein VF575_05645 [Candidatus Saccharimonadales bacterium]|jgi:hypothetical protein
MADDYNTRDRDYDRVRDAHTNSHVAKLLSTLALIASAIALAVALSAMNKATDALNLANRNMTSIQQTP